METIRRFEDLNAWKAGRALVNTIYDLTDSGAFAKDFGLRDQIRRSAVSGISNVAEGFDSPSNRRFAHFLGIARASLSETKTQLYVALDREYISQRQFDHAYDLCDKTARQISRFITYLRENDQTSQRLNDLTS